MSRSCHKLVCVKGTQRNEATISTVHKAGDTFPQIRHLERWTHGTSSHVGIDGWWTTVSYLMHELTLWITHIWHSVTLACVHQQSPVSSKQTLLFTPDCAWMRFSTGYIRSITAWSNTINSQLVPWPLWTHMNIHPKMNKIQSLYLNCPPH